MDGADGVGCPLTEAVTAEPPRGMKAPGTTAMVLGGLAGAVLAYVFQAVGGRVLGDEGFAPIAAIWTVMFIVASILLVPLEQYVTRETSRGRSIREDVPVVGTVGAIGVAAAVADVVLTLDSPLFGGNWVYPVAMALLLTGYTVLFTAKGVLAGNRRFADVGWLLGLEGVVLDGCCGGIRIRVGDGRRSTCCGGDAVLETRSLGRRCRAGRRPQVPRGLHRWKLCLPIAPGRGASGSDRFGR